MWFELTSALGLTYILKYGSILNKIRSSLIKNDFFDELFKCSLCLGFWSGILLSPLILLHHGVVYAILFPTAAAAFSWTVDTIHDIITKD